MSPRPLADTKYELMTKSPVRRLILRLAVPSVTSNLVSTIYNLADTYFIGQISTSASGAIGVAFVVMTLIQAIGFYFGQGTGNAIARALGRKDHITAEAMAAAGLALSFGLGALVAFVGHIFLEPICIAAGATPTILPYAKSYISIILLGAPWMAASLTLNMQLRLEGEATLAATALMAGALLNFALAPLFIFVMGLGIAGAALATVSCQLISFALLLWGCKHSSVLTLHIRNVHITPKLLREINNGGVPSLARQLVSGVAITLLNNAARPFGDAAIAAIAIVQRIVSFGNYLQIGIGQGFQPVCGYNYGAKLMRRVREGYLFSLEAAFCVVLAISFVTFWTAPALCTLFRSDPEVIRIATATLRAQSITLPITGIAMITNFVQQTTSHMWSATFLGLARLGIILVPSVLILTTLFGLDGLIVSQSASDMVTSLIATPMMFRMFSELKEAEVAA